MGTTIARQSPRKRVAATEPAVPVNTAPLLWPMGVWLYR
jgi:hypothetical protein